MANLDDIAPNYRRARQRWPEAPMLGACHDSLCACLAGSAHGQVEQVKAFIESVCRTIITELRASMPPRSDPSATELLGATLAPLGMQHSRGASALGRLLSGFNRLADALTTMRNENGPVAHGREGFLDVVAADHARAFLHAGDAILGVILNAYEGKQPDLVATREPYESFPHLNERIDRMVTLDARIDEDASRPVLVVKVTAGIRSEPFELRVDPSRLLYGIDREAYVDVLKSAELAIVPSEEEVPAREEPIQLPQSPILEGVSPGATLVPAYQGSLVLLRPALQAFLVDAGLDSSGQSPDGAHLVDSLLATAEENMGLDWKQRPPLQARVKVACKRLLVRFGSNSATAEAIAERFVGWLRVQAPDSVGHVSNPTGNPGETT
jgi:hypothetical protein